MLYIHFIKSPMAMHLSILSTPDMFCVSGENIILCVVFRSI